MPNAIYANVYVRAARKRAVRHGEVSRVAGVLPECERAVGLRQRAAIEVVFTDRPVGVVGTDPEIASRLRDGAAVLVPDGGLVRPLAPVNPRGNVHRAAIDIELRVSRVDASERGRAVIENKRPRATAGIPGAEVAAPRERAATVLHHGHGGRDRHAAPRASAAEHHFAAGRLASGDERLCAGAGPERIVDAVPEPRHAAAVLRRHVVAHERAVHVVDAEEVHLEVRLLVVVVHRGAACVVVQDEERKGGSRRRRVVGRCRHRSDAVSVHLADAGLAVDDESAVHIGWRSGEETPLCGDMVEAQFSTEDDARVRAARHAISTRTVDALTSGFL